MKIMTIVGTRPEIIRLTPTIQRLDRCCDHILVHTGQNFDPNLNDIFFRELGLRDPDISLDVRETVPGRQIGEILARSEAVMRAERPDRLLLLGDTNSALTAIMAKRLQIPVFHMEAGNRCYDDRVPEEVNRRVIDHSSDILMPYTTRSAENLVREGIGRDRIYVIGNPIYEVIRQYWNMTCRFDLLAEMNLDRHRYFLATMHRAENVDDPVRLRAIIEAFTALAETYEMPVVYPMHPRTRSRIAEFDIPIDPASIRVTPPLSLFPFMTLERNAFCVVTDSGTVQEECCLFQTPNVTVRDVTERPETIECGSNILAGVGRDDILRCVDVAVSNRRWQPPAEYVKENVSETVIRIVTGYHRGMMP
jgi:UDP-N-acetylglucosamine 2-epimerase (non-hydrolysing)